MDDLTLQVGVVHNIEINDAKRTDTCRAKIQRQRRAQTASADAQYLRSLKLELPFHADFGHDQVARIAQDFVVVQSDSCWLGLS